jgi:hypothetical protein
MSFVYGTDVSDSNFREYHRSSMPRMNLYISTICMIMSVPHQPAVHMAESYDSVEQAVSIFLAREMDINNRDATAQ